MCVCDQRLKIFNQSPDVESDESVARNRRRGLLCAPKMEETLLLSPDVPRRGETLDELYEEWAKKDPVVRQLLDKFKALYKEPPCQFLMWLAALLRAKILSERGYTKEILDEEHNRALCNRISAKCVNAPNAAEHELYAVLVGRCLLDLDWNTRFRRGGFTKRHDPLLQAPSHPGLDLITAFHRAGDVYMVCYNGVNAWTLPVAGREHLTPHMLPPIADLPKLWPELPYAT